VIVRGGGAHSAPSGGDGTVAPMLCGEPGTNMEKEIHRPSGDQLTAPGPRTRLVTRAVWPVSIQRIQIWAPPSTLDTQIRRSPLGLQAGEPWLLVPLVMGRCSPVAMSISQRFERC